MSRTGHPAALGAQATTATGRLGADPLLCDEYGYGLGKPDGILVLRYRSSGSLEFGENRQDFLHQLYWSPDGVLSTRRGSETGFIGSQEAFWARRGVSHEVRAADRQTVYRLFLREIPSALGRLPAGAVSIDAEAARLIQAISHSDCDESEALQARVRIMHGLGASNRDFVAHHAIGTGFALSVARALTHEPADPRRLEEWADELHVSVKTLQRDFTREFGLPFSQWRTRLRLRASQVLLETHSVLEVARRVGYSSPSAFVSAYTREYGVTPGRAQPVRRR